MMDAWALFLTAHNMTKDGMKQATVRISKIQPFYLSHCSQREGIMAKLEENGCAYIQSAIDHTLKKIFHDEVTDFISDPTNQWKWFNHSPGV